MLQRIMQAIGVLTSIIALIVSATIGSLLVFTHHDLPEGIDGPVSSYEGLLRKNIDLTLLTRKTSDRQGIRRVAVLQNDTIYTVKSFASDDNENAYFIIPVSRYYQTDFASIPPPADRLISSFGRHAEAAIVHDWLYAFGQQDRRYDADVVFYRSMVIADVPWLRRRLVYAAVRLGGEKSYGRANEWEGKFYIPELRSPLAAGCDFKSITPISNSFVEFSEENLDRIRNGNTEAAAQYLDDWWRSDWQYAFVQPGCMEFLADAAKKSLNAFDAFEGDEFSEAGRDSELSTPSNIEIEYAVDSIIQSAFTRSVALQALVQIRCEALGRPKSPVEGESFCREPMRVEIDFDKLPDLDEEETQGEDLGSVQE